MKYSLNRNHTLQTTTGHTIAFKKNELTHVPPEAVGAAVAIGAVPETDAPETIHMSREPANPAVRKAMLMAAIGQIVDTGGRDDFSGTGAPHQRAIAAIVGFSIDERERNALWDEYMQGKAAADEARLEAELDAANKLKADQLAAEATKTQADADAVKAQIEADKADADAAAELNAAEAKANAAKAATKPAAKPAAKPVAKPVAKAKKA